MGKVMGAGARSSLVLSIAVLVWIQPGAGLAGPGGDGPPLTPANLSVPSTDADGSYTINWGPSNADFYQLQIKVGSGSWSDYDLEPTNHKDVANQAEGTYSYRVKACTTQNFQTICSGYSNTDTVVVNYPPPVPAGLTAPGVDYNGSYTVSWNSSPTATLYKLQQRLNSGSWSQIHSASSTSKAISGNSPGTYRYRVRACEGSSPCSAWSSTRTVVVEAPPATPTGLSGPSTDYNGSYTVTWNSSARSTSYRLQQKLGSGSWSQVYSGSGTSKAISSNSAGTWYYRVRGCNAESICGSWSSTASVVVEAPPAVPGGLSGPGTDYNGSYTVNWNSSARSTSYRLQQKLGSGSWSQIYSGGGTSKSVSSNSAGTWYYRVRGCNAESVCSSWSSTASVVVEAAPAVPGGLSGPATDYNGSYTIDWNSSARSTSYRLQQRLGSGSWSQNYSGSSTAKAISGNSAGTWSYRVRGCNAESVCSGWSSTATVVVEAPPAVPSGLNGPATDYNGSYSVSWNTSARSTSYKLQERLGSGSWSQIYSGSATGQAVSGNIPGTWSYRVRGCNVESLCGGWSAIDTVTVPEPPAAPTGLTGPTESTDGDYTISWNAASGASSYRLQEKADSGAWSQIYSGSSTSKAINGNDVGVTYSYRVKSCNLESVCGGWSSTHTVVVTYTTNYEYDELGRVIRRTSTE